MRRSGVLMPISALPSLYGIGTMGNTAKKFVDFLKKSGQSYWQILPICPTGFGNSPYQSFSSFAGNPYFIDLEYLCKENLLKKKECESLNWGSCSEKIDYGALYDSRYVLFQKAQERFEQNVPEDFELFCNENAQWLEDFALFMALKDENDGKPWYLWEDVFKYRDYNALHTFKNNRESSIRFYKMLQYFFYKQWRDLKHYANSNGIQMIGDVPIYVARDSVDVWTNPGQFYLDENLNPIEVAGCPPDAFTEDGQLWGNPLFRWDVMKNDGYHWWTKRIEATVKLYDVIRIDHFRGFDSYYAIPAMDETARNGYWKQGPGMDLFWNLEQKLGKLPIIAEDLGFLTDSVRKLLWDSGFPGMKVLQFAFGSRDGSDYLPHNYPNHCVAYCGTHDNDTNMGWIKTTAKEQQKFAKEYLNLTKEEGYSWGMMRGIWASAADMVIVTMQDLLEIGSEGRLNEPSTLGENWTWRMKAKAIDARLTSRLYKYTQMYGRLNR